MYLFSVFDDLSIFHSFHLLPHCDVTVRQMRLFWMEMSSSCVDLLIWELSFIDFNYFLDREEKL